jgi:hypothetical protein
MCTNLTEEKPWLFYLCLGVLLIASLFWGPRLWRLYHHGAQDATIANLRIIAEYQWANP